MTGGDRAIRWAAAIAVVVVAAIAAVASYTHAYELVVTHGEQGALARALPLTIDGLIVSAGLVILDCARHRRSPPVLAWLLLWTGIAATLGANVAHGAAHGPVGMVVAGWPAAVATGCFEMSMRLVRGGRTAGEDPIAESEKTVADLPQFPEPDPVATAPEIRQQRTDLPASRPATRVADSAAPETGNGLAGSVVATPALAGLGLRNSTAEKRPAGGEIPHPDSAPETAKGLGDPVIATARDRFAEQLAAGELPSLRSIRRELHCGHPRAVRIREALTENT